MPHIEVLCFDRLPIRLFLKENMVAIREALAPFIGYPMEEIGLFVSPKDPELTDNMHPIEFLVNSGEKTVGVDDARAEEAMSAIVRRCPDINQTPFAVWIIGHGHNGFAVHQSAVHHV